MSLVDLAQPVWIIAMSTSLKTYVRPRSLTDCVFNNSVMGRFKHLLWRHALNGKRVRLQSAANNRPADTAPTVERLRAAGIATGNVTDFLGPEGLAALDETEAFIRARVASDEVQAILKAGRNSGQHKDYLVNIIEFDAPMPADHPVVRLASDERILSAVAEYMGMWPQIHAIGSWYNYPVDQEAKASQLWHRDPEDLKTVKIFIYLDDVGPKQGPFTYIPATHPFGPDCGTAPQHAHPRRVLDAEMERTFPRARWQSCTGPARTMVMADTVGFHRGGNVEEGHRLLITVTYTSGVPQIDRRLKLVGQPAPSLSPIQAFALRD